MSHFKIYGDKTPQLGQKSLCETCRWAHVSKGFRESELFVMCGAEKYTYSFGDNSGQEFTRYQPGETRVPFRVSECTGYSDKSIPTIAELKQKALIIDPDRVRVQGFAPKKD